MLGKFLKLVFEQCEEIGMLDAICVFFARILTEPHGGRVCLPGAGLVVGGHVGSVNHVDHAHPNKELRITCYSVRGGNGTCLAGRHDSVWIFSLAFKAVGVCLFLVLAVATLLQSPFLIAGTITMFGFSIGRVFALFVVLPIRIIFNGKGKVFIETEPHDYMTLGARVGGILGALADWGIIFGCGNSLRVDTHLDVVERSFAYVALGLFTLSTIVLCTRGIEMFRTNKAEPHQALAEGAGSPGE